MWLQVVVSYSQQLQDGLIKEGLNVTRLTVSGPDPYPNETVADQIVQQLGEPSIWTRYRWAAYLSITFTHPGTCSSGVTCTPLAAIRLQHKNSFEKEGVNPLTQEAKPRCCCPWLVQE